MVSHFPTTFALASLDWLSSLYHGALVVVLLSLFHLYETVSSSLYLCSTSLRSTSASPSEFDLIVLLCSMRLHFGLGPLCLRPHVWPGLGFVVVASRCDVLLGLLRGSVCCMTWASWYDLFCDRSASRCSSTITTLQPPRMCTLIGLFVSFLKSVRLCVSCVADLCDWSYSVLPLLVARLLTSCPQVRPETPLGGVGHR